MNSPTDLALTQLQLARESLDQVLEHLALAGAELAGYQPPYAPAPASLAEHSPHLLAQAFAEAQGVALAIAIAQTAVAEVQRLGEYSAPNAVMSMHHGG